MGFWGNLFKGTPQRYEQVSNLSPQQMQTQSQLMSASQNRGAGGVYGEAADYYRGLLSNESQDMESFAAPEMRRFREQTMPDLASQFAGMSAGDSGLSSSGFRNAAVGAGADLSERLAKMRADLRQNAAQGLQNIGNQALNPYMQNVNVPAQQGLLAQAIPAVLGAAGTMIGGPIAGAIGKGVGDWASGWFNPSTKASPEGARPDAGYSKSAAYPNTQFNADRR